MTLNDQLPAMPEPPSEAAVECGAWLAAERKRRSHRLCWNLISALAIHCAANEDKIIDLLTGYLFDEEEAGEVKAANSRTERPDAK